MSKSKTYIEKAKSLLNSQKYGALRKLLSSFPPEYHRQSLEFQLAILMREKSSPSAREKLFDEYLNHYQESCSVQNLLLAGTVKLELKKWADVRELVKLISTKKLDALQELSAREMGMLAAFNLKLFPEARMNFEFLSDAGNPAFSGQKKSEWDILISGCEHNFDRVLEIWNRLGRIETSAVAKIENILNPVIKAFLNDDRVNEAVDLIDFYQLKESTDKNSTLVVAEVYKAQGDFQRAKLILERDIAENGPTPEAEWNLALLELNMGELGCGWSHYRARWRWDDFTSPKRFFDCDWWDGVGDLNDKSVLIWGEQGVGDQLRFLTLLPNFFFKFPGARVTLEVDERLCPIVQSWYPEVAVQPYGPYDTRGQVSYQSFDTHFPSGDLGILFFNTADKIKSSRFRSMKVSEQTRGLVRAELLDRGFSRVVGISWRSNLLTKVRAPHYFSVEGFMTILKDLPSDVGLLCLQYGLNEQERAFLKQDPRVYVPDEDFFTNIDKHALYAGSCDLLVSCRTVVATLAGLFGVPVISWMKEDDPTFLGQELHPWFPNRFDIKTRPGFDKRALARRLKVVVDKFFASDSS